LAEALANPSEEEILAKLYAFDEDAA